MWDFVEYLASFPGGLQTRLNVHAIPMPWIAVCYNFTEVPTSINIQFTTHSKESIDSMGIAKLTLGLVINSILSQNCNNLITTAIIMISIVAILSQCIKTYCSQSWDCTLSSTLYSNKYSANFGLCTSEKQYSIQWSVNTYTICKTSGNNCKV